MWASGSLAQPGTPLNVHLNVRVGDSFAPRRSEHGCARNQVDDQAGELHEAERDDDALRIPELRGRLDCGQQPKHFERGVEREEENREPAQETAGPELFRETVSAEIRWLNGCLRNGFEPVESRERPTSSVLVSHAESCGGNPNRWTDRLTS